jgi:hypothetical protein
LHRSRRRGLFERTLFRLVLIKPMRCYRCNGRFYCPPTFFFRAAGYGKANPDRASASETAPAKDPAGSGRKQPLAAAPEAKQAAK